MVNMINLRYICSSSWEYIRLRVDHMTFHNKNLLKLSTAFEGHHSMNFIGNNNLGDNIEAIWLEKKGNSRPQY